MAVRIDGYFDRNFGDDYMIKTTLEHLPEVKFVIGDTKGVSQMLRRLDNVKISDEETEKTLRVIGSGFMVNSPEAFITELLWLIKGKKEPEWCIGCNIEPFKNPLFEWVIRKKLEKYELITARDKKSYEWLQKNCKKARVEYFPDILFSMEGLPRATGNKLGISLIHRSGDEENCTYYRAMAEIADHWVEATGQKVILFAFDSGMEDDVFACDCVKKMMKHPQMAEYSIHREGGEIIEGYTQCRKIIGARFHSIVLAIKMGIDVYPIIYRNKTKNLLEDIGYPIKGSPIDSINASECFCFLENESLDFDINEKYISTSYGHIRTLKEAIEKGS